MNKLIYYMSMVTIGLAIIILVYIMYLAFYPFKPVELNQSPFKITTPIVKAGDYVDYELNFTKHMSIKPRISWYLVDGTVVKLNDSGTSRSVGKQITRGEKLIPLSTKPNTYHLQVDLVYPVNLFQTKYYTWVSEDFVIVNGD